MGRADAIDWTPELESDVLKEIESGSNLRKAGSSHGISASAIIRHVQQSEEFAKQYAHAKEIQVEQLAEELLTIADSADSDTYNASRLQVDTRKWLLSKLIPKKYGDKVEQFISGPNGAPIQAAITVQFVKTGENS
jgi:hypothetical protein